MDQWTRKFDSALTTISHGLSRLTGQASEFLSELSLIEKGLIGGMGVLMLFYLFLPGGRGEGVGNASGKYFAGILLLVIAVGAIGGLLMAGHISF